MEITLSVKKTWQICQSIFIQFKKDGCANRAAALAFTTLLSLVPMFTISFTLLKALPVFQELTLKIQTFIINNFVAASAEMIQQHLQAFVEHTSKLSALGMVFFLFTAVLMIFNMEQAFNAIWRTKKQRSFLSGFLMYWAVLTLTPVLIGIGIAVSTYLASLPLISEAANMLGLKKILLVSTPYLATLTAFTVLYQAVPNCKVKFRSAFIGGIIATILFELAKQGFVLYITHFSVYRLLYGAMAAIPIFLVWIYFSWIIILFGAVVSATLENGAS